MDYLLGKIFQENPQKIIVKHMQIPLIKSVADSSSSNFSCTQKHSAYLKDFVDGSREKIHAKRN
jgi:hypothetical protein